MYNNGQLIREFKSDKNGKWVVSDVYLDLGYNSFTFKSKSFGHDLSKPSAPLVINYDHQPPSVNIELELIGQDQIVINLFSSEKLKHAKLLYDGKAIGFNKKTDLVYSAQIPLPDFLKSGQPLLKKMASFNVVAVDMVDNVAPTESVLLFIEALYPLDQAIVYNDSITSVGYASNYVDQILINGSSIVLDKNNAFSKSVQLDYGKQTVVFDVVTKQGNKLSYYTRLLCIRRFPDISKSAKYRRDIEFLATLGFITGKEDGLFHPDDTMTRRDITIEIAKIQKLVPKDLTSDPFLDLLQSDDDAGLISAAVDAGIVVAYSDGTFRPDELVSVEDAFKMLNNSGVINSDEMVFNQNPIKRHEYAMFLKNIRRYDQRVQYLLNWDEGYELP